MIAKNKVTFADWATLIPGISEMDGSVRKKVKGEKTLVTKIPEMGRGAVASSQSPVASQTKNRPRICTDGHG